MIDIKNLCLSFTKEYDALHNITLSIADGEKVAFVGDSDSGKTMLLRTIAGLEKFESGEVFVKNINIKRIDFKSDLSVAFVPKSCLLFENKTVRENLEYVLKIRNMDMATTNFKVLTALKNYDIEHIQNLKVKELSNFQKKLVQLARISVRRVDLFLIDDIFEDITDEETKILISKINSILQDNPESTFVFAFKNIDYAEMFGLRIVKLKYGCIVE